jgi:hypothetical protein
MSLPSPLSVGDIILLGNLACRVATALSSGSGSAPAEFVEVQTLLLSLKKSFDLLARTIVERDGILDEGADGRQNAKESPTEGQPELTSILNNCREVLCYLESFVEKYSILDPSSKDGEEPKPRTLKDGLRKTWKKVAWTKEGGDIGKLKQTLIAHTNALHLVVAVVNGSV